MNLMRSNEPIVVREQIYRGFGLLINKKNNFI